MLYDINFIIGLLITALLSTFVYFYFSQKIDEQNEKLNAVSMVVRAMAEEMTYFRNSGPAAVLPKEEPFVENKVFEFGLANIGINGPSTVGGDPIRSNELQLIAVSDDEDEDEDEDSDSESESGSGSDSEDTELCSNASADVDLDINEVEDLNENSTDKKEENNGNNENIKSVHMNVGDLEELGIFEELGDASGKLDRFLNMTETKVVEITEFKPSFDDDLIKASTTDYKKMPLSKLRSIVAEKKLCEDTSKMKKPELLELLKPFIGSVE
jgi:hypothetical protein